MVDIENEDRLPMHQEANSPIFRNAEYLRRNMTRAEKFLWHELRNNKMGVKFRRQHPLGIYIVDFYCHKAKLVIEIDGTYHNSKDQRAYDKIRTEQIISSGLREIRFRNEEVETNLAKVLQSIRLIIHEHL